MKSIDWRFVFQQFHGYINILCVAIGLYMFMVFNFYLGMGLLFFWLGISAKQIDLYIPWIKIQKAYRVNWFDNTEN